MRMVCDSTYIIDQDYERRHDTKIEELMNILDEVFESSGEKVVVFSQWMRMTYLVSKELEMRGVPFEYLHGSVPSEKRKDLFERFNNNPDCRVFLSTDAGSTGLNLQSASIIINLDIPWNPAVLEQRIARVHRMGQKSKVSVINFVANKTIEHRMLFVLVFKSALSQGVLDDGEDAIFMDTDKFTKFMETVEAVTVDEQGEAVITDEEKMEPMEMGFQLEVAAVEKDEEDSEDKDVGDEDEQEDESIDEEFGGEDFDDEEYEDEGIDDEDEDLYEDEEIADEDYFEGDDDIVPIEPLAVLPNIAPSTDIGEPAQPDPQELLAGGFRFLSGLAKTLSSPEATQQLVSSMVERDEKTGRSYVKIPVDDQQTVVNVMNMLGQLFKGFNK
jgi:superfamily II DNA/RNA helicase